MDDLFRKRQQRHVQMLIKYCKLVFNDHFVIALFFLAGALAYSYSQLLATVKPSDWWPRLVLVIFLTLLAQIGRLATLLEMPDEIFMLARSESMQAYFKQDFNYSLWPAMLTSLLGISIALPLGMTITKINVIQMLLIIITGLAIKTTSLAVNFQDISWSAMSTAQSRLWRWGLALICWIVAWYLGFAYACILALLACFWRLRQLKQLRINWRLAVEVEDDRMMSLYRFFNLFTDVPMVQGRIRRRRWANPIINFLGDDNAWSFLYSHALVRGNEIFGLLVRLTFLGMLVIFFIPAGWLNTCFSVLFLYLLMTQILPLFDQFRDNVFTYIYPLKADLQLRSFKRLLVKSLLVMAVLLALSALGPHLAWQQLVVNILILLIEVWALVRYYLPHRIKQIGVY